MTEIDERIQVGFRIREARESAGMDRAALASHLQVHPGSIARWESGGSLPQPYHVKRVAELAEVSEAWLRFGEGERSPRNRSTPTGDGTSLVTRDGMQAFIGGIAERGAERARKLDALEGYRQLVTTREPLPSWWYDLKTMIDRGEI